MRRSIARMAGERPSGAASTLEGLYANEAPRILAWARVRIRPEHRGLLQPEDVAQDVWCRALEKFDSFDPAHVEFRPWLFTVARFVLAEATRRAFYQQRVRSDQGRSSMVRVREEVPASITSVTSRAARDETMRRLFAVLDTCDDADRQLFALHHLEGMAQKDVGERLGLQANTVAKRWERLRARLREVAPAWLGEPPAD